MSWFKNWIVNHYAGKAVAVLAQFAGSIVLAHAGVLKTYGVTTEIDTDVLAGAILVLVHGVWAKWRGQMLKTEDGSKALASGPSDKK